MHKNTNTSVTLATTGIALLIFMGILVEVFAIPVNANSLQAQYSEYAGDAPVIDALLIGIVLFGQTTLVLVALLLSRISRRTLLSESAKRLVTFLMYSLGGVGVAFFALLLWLMAQNTLPPIVHIVIWVGILLAVIAALVIRTLRSVLSEAINNKTELEAVI
jgi:hypothetical protein